MIWYEREKDKNLSGLSMRVSGSREHSPEQRVDEEEEDGRKKWYNRKWNVCLNWFWLLGKMVN